MDRLPWTFSRSATRRCGAPALILTLAILLSHSTQAVAADNFDSVSFRQDVVPIFTRYGCNAGNCHGKVAGQNGFRLSLRGYAPEWDYEWLTKELNGRRIDYACPESSLILLKATAQIGHEGGKRFDRDSRAAQVLAQWIKNRTPAPDPAESDADKLEIITGGGLMKVGQTQQLAVKAHWPDGRSRDVTWLCQFFSNDETTVSVTPEGLVKALRNGEAAVRVHFQGLVQVAQFTMPFDAPVDPAQYARKNNFIDEHVFAKLAALRIPVSPACDDATFIRRAYLDTIGELPTAEEVAAFLADHASDKRARLIDHLLATPEWADYWAMNLCDVLQNRKERDHDVRGPKNVRAFHAWVRNQLIADRPWNQIARDVILATGDAVTHPEIGYYIYTIGEKQRVEESEVAESLAMSFLGTRIGCAKCHNHPLEKFTQDDYYRFAAFFAKVSLKRTDPEKGVTILSVGSQEEREARKQVAEAQTALTQSQQKAGLFKPESEDGKKVAKEVAQAELRLKSANKRLQDAIAKPPAVQQPRTKKMMPAMPLDHSQPQFQSGHDPRETLVAWITDPSNQSFSGNMVNRLWRHFMGVGLVEQVDDLRSSNPPSNPQLWNALTQDFVAQGYDLKSLMRRILNSRAYQLSSQTLPDNEQDRRFYSHYFARRLPAEVFSDAIAAATAVPDAFPGYPGGLRAVQLPDPGVASYFLTIFGRSDRVTACACERTGDVTLPQLLYLNNGEDLRTKLRASDGRLDTLLKKKLPDDQLIDQIFLTTLARTPTQAERTAVKETLAAGDPREEVFRDLFWALLNTKEFAFNH